LLRVSAGTVVGLLADVVVALPGYGIWRLLSLSGHTMLFTGRRMRQRQYKAVPHSKELACNVYQGASVIV
jgi:hypothetical protein